MTACPSSSANCGTSGAASSATSARSSCSSCARLEEMQREPAPLSSSSEARMARDQARRPSRTSASCSSATGATCSSPFASRRSQPCRPATGRRRVAEQAVEIRDRPAAHQRHGAVRGRRAAARAAASSVRVHDHRARVIRELEQGSVHVEKQAPGSRWAAAPRARRPHSRGASCIIRAVYECARRDGPPNLG